MTSVLFLSTMNGQPWGGSEELWSRAAAHLSGAGHEVTCAVLAWPDKAPRLEALRAAGCTVRGLPNWGRCKRNPLDRFVHEALAKPAREVAVRCLPWPRFDHVVVSQAGWADATARPFRQLDRLARGYSLVYHSYSEDGAPERPDDLRRLAMGARRNFFVADRIREVLSGRIGIELPNTAVVYNPLTIEKPPDPPRWNRSQGPLRIVGLGYIHLATKAQDLVVEALSGEEWRRREWRLDLFGEGQDRARLQSLIRERGLTDRIWLRGYTADVAGALAEAHLVVQASRVDAMPIVLHEAMAMSRPCVVTRMGDMPRWISEGDTGFIADRAEVLEVARAMERAWAARGRLEEMGRRARERFQATFPTNPVQDFARMVLAAASGAERYPI